VLVCLAALLWNRPAPLLRLVDYLGRHVAATAAASAALFAACAVGVYKNYPLSMDEYSAVFQSKVFASGHLAAQLPPALVPWLIAPGFNGHFLLISAQTGRGIETYWPGFALVLAPFQLLGIPWLCNATLAGLAIFLIHRITLELTLDRRAAGNAVCARFIGLLGQCDFLLFHASASHGKSALRMAAAEAHRRPELCGGARRCIGFAASQSCSAHAIRRALVDLVRPGR
jgi:hypothetical protein